MVYIIINFYYLYPHPNLPPGGQEQEPFPLGGNGKGGHLE